MAEKPVVTPEEMNKQLGRVAFAALTALKLAQCDGLAGRSEQAENLFLVRWFKTALTQKRFHRCVAADLVWLSNRFCRINVLRTAKSGAEALSVNQQTELFCACPAVFI